MPVIMSASDLEKPSAASSQEAAENAAHLASSEPETIQDGGNVDAPEQQYPSGIVLGVTLFGLCIAVFCVALDNTIISTAIPSITDDFHALDDVGWYGSAYLLTTCGKSRLGNPGARHFFWCFPCSYPPPLFSFFLFVCVCERESVAQDCPPPQPSLPGALS